MAQRGLPQSKEALLKSYSSRLKDDVKSLLENFEGRLSYVHEFCTESVFIDVSSCLTLPFDFDYLISEIIKLAKGESDSQLSRMTQCEQDTYEMHVRSANIVSILKCSSFCDIN